ncbi:alpha-L-rhamnosidase [Acidicapsa ligni]|uniref:alpha-L-rhamnosidase n=1 Tax=Acidicapsa ligni TaxID=542300 RepID=UPI0021E026F5|nr:alpha-L-rhamnosidase [Acidicapsa ligni]
MSSSSRWIDSVVTAVALSAVLLGVSSTASAASNEKESPTKLRVDDLVTPLGLDDHAPHFSWVLRDVTRGAMQTSYSIQVATRGELLVSNKADVWDSGRIHSGQSVNVTFAGPALMPSTRYFWRVMAWDKDGDAYPVSETSWWETGLLDQQNWHAQWIGYETWEEAAVREAKAAWVTSPDGAALDGKAPEQKIGYRLPFTLNASVRRAVLFVTGQDVASAWVNGAQVAKGASLPPYKQFPWKKYVQIEVTSQVKSGANLLAIETTHYGENSNGFAGRDTPMMNATLVAELTDGSTASFATGMDSAWKTSVHPAEGWTRGGDEDASWKPLVIRYTANGVDSGSPGNPWPAQTVKSLRHEFVVRKQIASARLYATALGAYEVFLNGKRTADDVLAPGWTDYRLRLKYQTYDVTKEVAQGRNALAALVAPGWYSTPLEWFQQPNVYGVDPPSLMVQLRIQYADGSVDWIVSDANWKADASSILKAEIYDGETQDARLIQTGWNAAHFDASKWKPVEVHAGPRIAIDGQDFQPIRVERTLTPKALTEPRPGVFIYDMGQNFSGVEKLHLKGPAGTDVQVRTGEILNADGTLYTDNLRTALSTDHFILAGKGEEEFQPQFTFHGFRYLELTGVVRKPSLSTVTGVVFHTDAAFTAQLKTGSGMINSLWSNILWGQRSNFVGVPTDCPQRDERLGWMADAQVFWRTATYNMDLAAFSRKYSADMRGTQVGSASGTQAEGAMFGIYAPGISTTSSDSGAGWSDAGVIIPWTSWMQNGDTTVVQQNWNAMTKYLAAIEVSNPDHLWKKNAGIGFGDWLSPEGPTYYPLVATASWAYDITLMKQMAHALGKTQDEAKYAALFEEIKASFEKEFVHADGFVEGADHQEPSHAENNPDAKAKTGDTQTGYVLALQVNLVPENLRGAVAQKLVDKIEANHGLLGTGFLGTPYLLAVLTETGHRDLAYHLLLNTTYPSWGYLVDHGATTMWERWNGDKMKDDPSMNSYNHYAYGAVADWIYRYAAGVDATPMDAGFHTVYLHPAFDAQLGSIDFSYPSPYGEIHSAWSVKDGTAHWQLTIPANASGWLPLSDAEAGEYKLDGQALASSKLVQAVSRDSKAGYVLPAGNYSFVVSGVR